ncbi:hypothetical protein BCR42DRAFT_416131 [Absidia repens]|uniref:Uncharacterized protein n=1 Tax=Absidia repens TaxID=90262 RepID=A0A1X2IGH9_9FUNG|nr:hypothetical protein BCR42DRAFT_416131 [Absidia repens]
MERIHKTETSTSYDSKDGGMMHSTMSTVTVRELDDGEVGILLAGNNSILDPGLAPHMLNVPTTIDYDISDAESTISTDMTATSNDNRGGAHGAYEEHDPLDDNDNWFPSLSKASWIQDLDKNDHGKDGDDDTLMTDRTTVETLFASDIVEIDDDDDDDDDVVVDHSHPIATTAAAAKYERPSKSRRTSRGDSMDKNQMEDDIVISDSYGSLEKPSGLVPLDVVHVVLND